jgi:hypothetical protein
MSILIKYVLPYADPKKSLRLHNYLCEQMFDWSTQNHSFCKPKFLGHEHILSMKPERENDVIAILLSNFREITLLLLCC